jgi:hypothetical protein
MPKVLPQVLHRFAAATDDLLVGMKASNSEQIRDAVTRLQQLRTDTHDDSATWGG